MRSYEIVLSIPHASTYIPDEIRTRMVHADSILNREPDLYTDQIYNIQGPRIVQAKYSRVISDVNRAPDEIYTSGPERSMGVIMLSLSHGQDIFEVEPSLGQLNEWIQEFHKPYHAEVNRALKGAKFLIDCHSMWSEAPPSRKDAGRKRPDIVLGNRLYTTCDARTTKFFRDFLVEKGYSVEINNPFIGRYVVGTHCSRKGTPGIQIEMNRGMYMNEDSLELYQTKSDKLKEDFGELVEAFCEWDESSDRTTYLCDLSVQ
jgi:N-formylglutamate deformylase